MWSEYNLDGTYLPTNMFHPSYTDDKTSHSFQICFILTDSSVMSWHRKYFLLIDMAWCEYFGCKLKSFSVNTSMSSMSSDMGVLTEHSLDGTFWEVCCWNKTWEKYEDRMTTWARNMELKVESNSIFDYISISRR